MLLQDSVPVFVGQVLCDGGRVDVADRGAVVGRVQRAVVFQEFGNLAVERRLEEWDSRPGAWVLSDQGMGRVGCSQGAREEL